ncbi:Transcription factor [Apiospora saccharicola]|uniref:Transcription factor n=1 Tax=Apiospora saccharicola TaxID=335842 RepID=A0ABR1WCW4_9PEZI
MESDASHPTLHSQLSRPLSLQFAASHDGRLQHARQVWDQYKSQIWQLYIVDRVPLPKVAAILQGRGFDASLKMYRSRIQSWGWTKNKPRRKAVVHADQPSNSLCPAVPSSAPSRLHGTLIQQTSRLLVDQSESGLCGWGPGNYGDSVSALSLSDIIQGNQLARRKHITEGFCLIRRGFSNIGHVFETQTLNAMLDMIVHIHRYCDPDIIQNLFNHLVKLSEKNPQTGKMVHDSLDELLRLSASPDLPYIDTILETQFYMDNELRRQGAFREPSVLTTLAAGVAPYLSQSPWIGTDWKDFLISSMDQMRCSMRDRYGVHDLDYHTWLFRHLGKTRNICGEGSEIAFELALSILNELDPITPQSARLLPECWITMAQYHWGQHQQQAERGLGNPRADYAIHLLCEFTNSREASGAASDVELGWLLMLESWQMQTGRVTDAVSTARRGSEMVRKIGEVKVENV